MTIDSLLASGGVQSFAEMSNIAKELRQRLDETFIIGRPEIVTEQVSIDGTRRSTSGPGCA